MTRRPFFQILVELMVLIIVFNRTVNEWNGCEPSQVLKSGLAYAPQISPLYVRISEIIVSNILQARAGFSLLGFVCRLELKRA